MKILNTNARGLAAAFALAALFAPGLTVMGQAAGGAQQQGGAAGQSLKGAQLKGKVPVNKEVLKVRLPKPQEATLKNGLRLLLIENHNAPVFTAQLVVMSGGLGDPAEKRGRASMTAALLREGTATRQSREIAEAFDRLGSTLAASAGTSSFTTNVSSSGLAENIGRTLELLADVVRNPSFPQDEIDKYKTRLVTQLQYQRTIPGALAQEQFARAVYGEHPAGHVFPTEANIKGLTRQDLVDFHAANYGPTNAVVAVIGE